MVHLERETIIKTELYPYPTSRPVGVRKAKPMNNVKWRIAGDEIVSCNCAWGCLLLSTASTISSTIALCRGCVTLLDDGHEDPTRCCARPGRLVSIATAGR